MLTSMLLQCSSRRCWVATLLTQLIRLVIYNALQLKCTFYYPTCMFTNRCGPNLHLQVPCVTLALAATHIFSTRYPPEQVYPPETHLWTVSSGFPSRFRDRRLYRCETGLNRAPWWVRTRWALQTSVTKEVNERNEEELETGSLRVFITATAKPPIKWGEKHSW